MLSDGRVHSQLDSRVCCWGPLGDLSRPGPQGVNKNTGINADHNASLRTTSPRLANHIPSSSSQSEG
ncbi:hypothetical protein EYF80_036502 [Liparis tanakae]|uniref:Uncharacterized protein n=1 Tax=Liparis tanakae TaxID=230148 RepID=A0A4Z2GI89_9TELE|nr:hypothetical protein EYF80_036502 [Liparis tanakae]